MRLGRELSYEGHFGQFGRFVFDNYAFEATYQDVILKMDRIELWVDQPYRIERVFEWSFGIPAGNCTSRRRMTKQLFSVLSRQDGSFLRAIRNKTAG